MNAREERYATFRQEAEDAEFDVEDYQGRGGYDGPAVRVDDDREYQKLIRATSMYLTTDGMGRGMIVYPK